MRRAQRLENCATFCGFVTFDDFDVALFQPSAWNLFGKKRDGHVIETQLK